MRLAILLKQVSKKEGHNGHTTRGYLREAGNFFKNFVEDVGFDTFARENTKEIGSLVGWVARATIHTGNGRRMAEAFS